MAGRPKSPENSKHSEVLRFRLKKTERELLEHASEIAKLSFSDWARSRLENAARAELKSAGEAEATPAPPTN